MKILEPSLQAISLFDAVFSPRTVALIGASGDLKKNTARPLAFMRKHGFQGQIFPVNAQRSEIGGEKAYPSLADIPGQVDHVFVMVPGAQVLEVVRQCAARHVQVMTIFSDGFAEVGPEGKARQDALVRVAHEAGIRLIGPNSIGVANVHTGAVLSVNAVFQMEQLVAGPISLVSQSGSMMGALLSRGATRGFGFSKLVSVGNEADVGVGEIVHGLVDDPATKVILLFLETLRDAPVLGAALDRARDAGKPVIVYKLGRSAQGEALSESHTGAIAGNDAAVDAYFQAHGVMRVEMLETMLEMATLAQTYARTPIPHGRNIRVGVITTTGGGAATVVDRMGLGKLEAVAPPDDFIRHMAARGVQIRQTPVIDLTLAATSAQYKDLLEQMLKCDWCDAVLSVVGSSAQFHPELAVRPLVEADKSSGKPLAVFLAPEAPESLALLQKHGIAAFRTPEACADALTVFFGRHPQAKTQHIDSAWPADVPQSGNLTEFEACKVFATLGVPMAKCAEVSIDALTHELPYPVVLKLSSREILHKTEVEGVAIGIANDAQLRAAAITMAERVPKHAPGTRVDRLLVQQMEGRLLEMILGYRRDPLVGPVVVLGAGGIAAELADDYAVRLAPVTLDQAHAMIDELKCSKLLKGYRGLPQGDCDALARTVQRFSHLADVAPKVFEAEINPLFVQALGVVGVDGLIRLA